MINCGAICNVTELLSHQPPEAYVYIVDSNRPIHLANVYPRRDRYLLWSNLDGVSLLREV